MRSEAGVERVLPEHEAAELLARSDIPYPRHETVRTSSGAVAAADRMGYPVVTKVVARGITHKTDHGGVALGLLDGSQVRDAAERLLAVGHTAGDSQTQLLVASQAPPGLELIIGAVEDRELGRALMLGAGGVLAELLDDAAFRLAPLSRRDAEAMLDGLRVAPLLRGHRGAPLLDQDAVVDALLAVSSLMGNHPEIVQLDLNPLRVYESGVLVLDARVFVKERTDR